MRDLRRLRWRRAHSVFNALTLDGTTPVFSILSTRPSRKVRILTPASWGGLEGVGPLLHSSPTHAGIERTDFPAQSASVIRQPSSMPPSLYPMLGGVQ